MRDSIQIARAILHDRGTRRKWLLGTMLFAVALVAFGTWIGDGWVNSSAEVFACYWFGVFGTVCFLLLFALYDLLKAMKGE
ncbi:hypothetical protein ACFPK9_04925 [Rubritalea spongiae]|uniref:hypothetical protein n=1 Tax=Rubritalea spongiae TaxID=430797 RepID=UPI0036110BAD